MKAFEKAKLNAGKVVVMSAASSLSVLVCALAFNSVTGHTRPYEKDAYVTSPYTKALKDCEATGRAQTFKDGESVTITLNCPKSKP